MGRVILNVDHPFDPSSQSSRAMLLLLLLLFVVVVVVVVDNMMVVVHNSCVVGVHSPPFRYWDQVVACHASCDSYDS